MFGRQLMFVLLGLMVVGVVMYMMTTVKDSSGQILLRPSLDQKYDNLQYMLNMLNKDLEKEKVTNEELITNNKELQMKLDQLSERVKSVEKKATSDEELESNDISLVDNCVVFPANPVDIRMWIDVPNSFPWRKCLHEYNGQVFTYGCNLVNKYESSTQSMILTSLESDRTKFRIILAKDKTCMESVGNEGRFVRSCSDGYWQWTGRGQLRYSNGNCLASTGAQAKTILVDCDHTFDDQIVEIGQVNNSSLGPYNMKFWKDRMDLARNEEIEAAKIEVDAALEEIKKFEDNKDFEKIEGNRRAIVFYVDKGSGFLAYLTWWIYAWRLIGLDSDKEAFDIILMTHPESIKKLPTDCVKVPEDFDPRSSGPGQCLYKELVPISERNHKYDNYLNSQECLFNPTAEFLHQYKILIRADLDTFPTPAMVNFWPNDIICNRNAVTTHYRSNIEEAIIGTAKAAGIEHQHWHNTDSAWMGPSLKIITLSKLTTYLARFTRVHMFGPGTLCRCPTCINLPTECEWGQGIYAGTLLLYAQEIAMNRLWSQREYDEQKTAMLDGSCTDSNIHICASALLHARHNADPFSKFTFLRGGYKKWDMSKLDITNVRDYSMYVAIASAGQGINSTQVIKNYAVKHEDVPLGEICNNL